MKCPSCGKDNPDTSKFCGYCGAKMGAPEIVRPPEPPRPVDMPPPPRAAGMPPSAGAPRQAPMPPRQGYPQQAPPRPGHPQQMPPAQYQAAPRARVGYPPPPQRPMQAPGAPADKSNQQRMIIIAAAAAVLVLVIVCAAVAFFQRDAIVGMIDPAGRETQMQADINNGLTQTAAVSVDVPATVQAQIALTQTAVAPAAPAEQPAAPAEQPAPADGAQAAPPAADPADAQYAQSVKDSITAYNEAMGKINELLTQATTDQTKLQDAAWKTDFTTATAKVTQTSEAVRALSAPQKFGEVQTEMTNAATNLDNAVKLLSEYLTDLNADKVSQAATAKDAGNTALTNAQSKLTALGF